MHLNISPAPPDSPLHHFSLGLRSLAAASLPLLPANPRLSRRLLGFGSITAERDRAVGEVGDREGVAEVGEGVVVVEVEEGGEERPREEARCSRRVWYWRKVEDSRRASAFRPDEDKLVSRALAWLGEMTGGSGYLLRPGGGTKRPEKMPDLMLDRSRVALPLLLLLLLLCVPNAFRRARRQDEGKTRYQKKQEPKNHSLQLWWAGGWVGHLHKTPCRPHIHKTWKGRALQQTWRSKSDRKNTSGWV